MSQRGSRKGARNQREGASGPSATVSEIRPTPQKGTAPRAQRGASQVLGPGAQSALAGAGFERTLTNSIPGNAPESGEVKLKGATGSTSKDFNRGDDVMFIVRGTCVGTGVKDIVDKNDPREVKTSVRVHDFAVQRVLIADRPIVEMVERALVGMTGDVSAASEPEGTPVGRTVEEAQRVARRAVLDLTQSADTANAVAMQVAAGLEEILSTSSPESRLHVQDELGDEDHVAERDETGHEEQEDDLDLQQVEDEPGAEELAALQDEEDQRSHRDDIDEEEEDDEQ